jgi:hypothetical protein
MNVPIRRRQLPSYEDRQATAATIRRSTGALEPGGLAVQWPLLEDDEARELVSLTRKAGAEGGFNSSLLAAREAKHFERLAEKGAGKPGAFGRVREAAHLQVQTSQLGARARKRKPLRPQAEARLVHDVHEHLEASYLHAEHVALLYLLVGQFQTGRAFAPRTHFEGAGDALVLVVDINYGLVPERVDPESKFCNWQRVLDHLATNSWVAVERKGSTIRIRLGSRTLAALKAGEVGK